MRHWMIAGLLFATSAASAANASAADIAPTPTPTLAQRVFRLPKADAIGAAVGAVVAVQVAQRWPARKGGKRSGR